ncbi:hypothetical protein [Mycobacterium sp.]|uniref:hypothetical protein n=1 Tax=Mycobacterium sp. TaxID=1785 RepID=UPI003D0B1EFD
MFEQHARWLEELQAYARREEAVTCRAGYMPLTAIAQEIAIASADARVHDHQQVYNWDSMAADLSDSLNWIGPELLALVDIPARAVQQAITNGVLMPRPNSRPSIDDSKRSDVATLTAVLAATLDQDDVLVAAWRDLVAGCRDLNHVLYPSERIAFLRDTLVGLSEYRRQDRRYFSPISTAVQVLIGSEGSVRQAQAMVGDPVATAPYTPQAKAILTDAELESLAARCILERPPVSDYVVWFRLSEGYFVEIDPCVTNGDITFYEAQGLAQLLIRPDQARKMLDVVPEELLTNEIRDLQLSRDVSETNGFEYLAGLVYARVTVHDVEHHRAVDTARMHLDAVLAVVGHHERMWKVLGGFLFFDLSPGSWNPIGARWGALKEPLPEPVFYQNDHFATDLARFAADGHLITAETAHQLRPALRLSSTLDDTPRADSEAIVMAAVRAIEHCNAWTAPTRSLKWYRFIDDYLTDVYTLRSFAKRVVVDVFEAAQQYPDHTPGATPPPELGAIQQDIILDGGWGTRIDSPKTIAHVARLRGIYANHWLVRRLAESGDILSSPAALSAAFDTERHRVAARVRRLTRSRNAAVHGGPLSEAACSTITDCALALAQEALNTAIWAIVTGRQPDAYAISRRDEHRQRIHNLTSGGDLANLFKLTP